MEDKNGVIYGDELEEMEKDEAKEFGDVSATVETVEGTEHSMIVLKPKKEGDILEEVREIHLTNGRVVTLRQIVEVRIGKTNIRIKLKNGEYFVFYHDKIVFMRIVGNVVL